MINNVGSNFYTPSMYTPQASAVNLQIFNPQAFSSYPANENTGHYMPYVTPYPPINTPVYTQNSLQGLNQSQTPAAGVSETPSQNPQGYVAPNGNEGINMPGNDANLKSNSELSVKNNNAEKKTNENKSKVNLTDDYIRNLENYLSSQDPKVRLMGAKELLERFREDESRASDKALNALLNKTIQDPNNTVKFVGLTILDAGYSKGNDETVKILKNIQQDALNQYGEDSLLASQILLKMSAKGA